MLMGLETSPPLKKRRGGRERRREGEGEIGK